MAIELAEQTPAAVVAPDAVTTALVEVTTTNAKMTELAQAARDLAAQYRDVVADVTTGKGYDQIAAIRTELRTTARFPMQKLQEAGSKMLGQMQKQFNERAKDLIEEVKALEKPFQDQLDAEDARKANEKAERDLAEALRVQGHVDALAIITGTTVQASGLDAAGIKELIDQLAELVIGEDWEEFRGQAQQAKDEALRQLNGLHVAALADEQERAELAAERQRQAEFRQQQEAQVAELQRQQQALAQGQAALARQQQELAEQRAQQERAQQERAQAVQRRIDALASYGAAYSYMAASTNIESELRTLQDTLIYRDQYDDRVGEAEAAKASACERLRAVFDAAVAREAEEARQARATQIQANLDIITGAVASAHNATTSAELLQFHSALMALEPTLQDFGERLEEAGDAKEAGLSEISVLLQRMQERERRAAEEAERQRQEIEANAAKVARMTRMQDAAPRMFALLGELVANPVYASELADAARAIINEIEGDN